MRPALRRMQCVALIFLLLTIPRSALAAELPVEAFASKPDVTCTRLSPSGKHIASIIRVKGEYQGAIVNVFDVETGESSHHLYTDNSKFILEDLDWVNDQELLVSARFPTRYGTVQVTETRLLQLNINTGKSTNAVPRSIYKKFRYTPQFQADIIDLLPDEKDYFLLQLAGTRDAGEPSVYRIKLRGKGVGRYKLVQPAKQGVYDWITDQQHNIRLAIRQEDSRFIILEQHPDRDGLRELWNFDTMSIDSIWPLGFDADPNILFVRAYHGDYKAVFNVDLRDPDLSLNLIYQDPTGDVTGNLRIDKQTGKVVGIGNVYWDESYANLKVSLDKTLSDSSNYLIDFSADANRYIALSSNDVEPGVYYLGDRKAKSLEMIAARYDALTSDVLAQREPIAYQARDGLNINGYLTLPLNTSGKKLPTIIFPHGGPIDKETSGFDYWSQFLVNRGYAVLQMDFRGSSGYGYNFMSQGLQGWGKAMQDDVEDGAQWLIEQGIADANRICIMGASYGGYASLMGTVKSPDLYQCAVSFAGVMDVEALVKHKRYFVGYKRVLKQIGDDFSELWDISPMKYVKDIDVPVLLIHGKRDTIVPYRQSEEMFEELQDEGKSVQFVSLDGGDHYLSNAENRIKTFKAIEDFLATHLKSQNVTQSAGN